MATAITTNLTPRARIVRGMISSMLVQPHQEDGPFAGSRFAGKFMGALAIVVEHAYPPPPVSRGTGEAPHFRRLIAAREVVAEFPGRVFVREPANLHRPLSARIEGRRG